MARIKHIAFFTEDADRMAKFYVEVFGNFRRVVRDADIKVE